MRLARSVPLLVLAWLVQACTWLGVWEVDAPECTSHAQCDLDAFQGLDEDDCVRWQCSGVPLTGGDATGALTPGRCVLEPRDLDGDGALAIACGASDGDCDDLRREVLPGGVEVCDGLDNDCDGRVDEPPDDATDRARFAESYAPSALGAAAGARVAWAARAGAVEAIVEAPGGMGAARRVGEARDAPLRYAVSEDAARAACVVAGATGPSEAIQCTFGATAWDAVGATTFVATLNATGACPQGDLRVGLLEGDTLVLPAALPRAPNSLFGVDRFVDDRLGVPLGCVGTPEAPLARALALRAFEGEPYGLGGDVPTAALLAWLRSAPSAADATCGASAAESDVVALGLLGRQGMGAPRWVDATGEEVAADGRSTTRAAALGRTRGAGAPALLPLGVDPSGDGRAEWMMVAWGDAVGGLRLVEVRLPAEDAVPCYRGERCGDASLCDPAPRCCQGEGCADRALDRTGLGVGPLRVGWSAHLFEDEGAVAAVALARRPGPDVGDVDVGVAWRTCAGAVRWTTLRVDPLGGRPPAAADDPVTLTDARAVATSGPAVGAHPAVRRAAAGAADAPADGFVIAWVDAVGDVLLRRVAAGETGPPVEPLLSPFGGADTTSAGAPFVYADPSGAPRLATRRADTLVDAPLACTPP